MIFVGENILNQIYIMMSLIVRKCGLSIGCSKK